MFLLVERWLARTRNRSRPISTRVTVVLSRCALEQVAARFNIDNITGNAQYNDPRENEHYRLTVWDGKTNAFAISPPLGTQNLAEYAYQSNPALCRSVTLSSTTMEINGRPDLGVNLAWIEVPGYLSWQVAANVKKLGIIVESGQVVAGINPSVGIGPADTRMRVSTVDGAAVPDTEVMLRLDSTSSSIVNMPTVEQSTSRPDRDYTLAHRYPLKLVVREVEQVTVSPALAILTRIAPLAEGQFQLFFSPPSALITGSNGISSHQWSFGIMDYQLGSLKQLAISAQSWRRQHKFRDRIRETG